jgi:hypothetical protein
MPKLFLLTPKFLSFFIPFSLSWHRCRERQIPAYYSLTFCNLLSMTYRYIAFRNPLREASQPQKRAGGNKVVFE